MKNQIKKLIQITSEVFEIEDIYSTSRQTHFVFARAIIFYLMRNNLFMTYVKIAKVFNKNHATIMHAVKQLPYMLKYDQDLQQKYNNIKLMWLENESHNFISKENSLKNLTDRNNLLNLMVEEYKSHTHLLNNKLLSMVNHEDCKYSVDDVDKIYNYTTWSVKKKVDTLLHIDCSMYCNLGLESTTAQRKDVKQKSRIIYRTIKKLDEAAGKQFLQAMD